MNSTTLKISTLLVGIGLAALVGTVSAEAGGWGHGPSWSQARKDAGQAVKSIHNAFSAIPVSVGTAGTGGGGAGMRAGEGDDGRTVAKTVLLPLVPQTYEPRPSGPSWEQATPGTPCGTTCPSRNDYIENPAGDLPEKQIEAPTPVAD
jgi:hypothetical protein